MNKDKAREKLRRGGEKALSGVKERLESSSIVRFRIASGTEVPNTVPVNVLNQSWPVFVFPEVFIDGRHVINARYIEKGADEADSVLLKIGLDGCNRLNAIGDDKKLTVVMFIDNYPIHNIAVQPGLYDAEVLVDCFPTNEQAKYFYEVMCQEIA